MKTSNLFSVYIFETDVQTCLTFPWPLRLVQRKCMDLLKDRVRKSEVKIFCKDYKIIFRVKYKFNKSPYFSKNF